MNNSIRYWNWRTNPNEPATWGPEVRLVVCAPPLDTACGSGLFGHTCGPLNAEVVRAHVKALDAFDYAYRSGRRMVVHVDDYDPAGHYPDAIPALTLRTQADLDGRRCVACSGFGVDGAPFTANEHRFPCVSCSGSGTLGGIRALLAVQAERRALVCSPREEIDLGHTLEVAPLRGGAGYQSLDDGEGGLPGAGRRRIDLVIILGETGPDARPMHPHHVRKLVAQCKAAGVPALFLGWGDWVPEAQQNKLSWAEIVGTGEAVRVDDDWYLRIGPDRSGSKLDGAEVCDLPEWVTAS